MARRPRTPRHGALADLANPGVGRGSAPTLTAPAPALPVVEPATRPEPVVRPRRGREPAVPFAAPPAPTPTDDEPTSGPRWRRRRRSEVESTPERGVLELPEPAGFVVRRKVGRARRGWYAPQTPAALTSTRQAEVLNTALVAAPTGVRGIINGRDALSNLPVAHDPFTAYADGTLTSPNVAVLGVVGSGKSSLLKTVYVLRPLIMRNRRAVVMDKKDRGGEGEYCEIARELGSEPLRMVLGDGGTSVNLLDPAILAGSGVGGQARLLISVAEQANNGEPLEKWEKAALAAAHRATLRSAEADARVPLLADLLTELTRMHPEFDDYSTAAKERMHQASIGVHMLLTAMVADELSGLFDRPTSPGVGLADKLTVFDLSQLPDEGPSTSMVMTVANVWLMGTLRNYRGLQTNFIAEEGWSLVGGPGGKVLERNAKLARGLGLSNIAALHHVADIPAGDPAIAMLKEAQTIHLYRQDNAEDIEAVIRMYGLEPGMASTLASLGNGHHLLKIGDGNRPVIHVEHVRSAREKGLTATDEGMVLQGTRAGQ